MIAVVTGSSGFIGSHLLDRLLARGAEVRVLLRTRQSAPNVRAKSFVIDPADERSLRDRDIWRGVSHVFHIAGTTRGCRARDFHQANVVYSANLLAAIASQPSSPPRIILMSSLAAAGPAKSANAPVVESDVPAPVEWYGVSKLKAEYAADQFRPLLPIAVVRPAAVYGARDRDLLVAFRQALARVQVYGSPRNQQLSIVHVNDVVSGVLLAASSSAAIGSTYFLANDEPVTWASLYEAISAFSPRQRRSFEIPRAFLSAAATISDVTAGTFGARSLLSRQKVEMARHRFWTCSNARAKSELAWQPEVTLADGLKDTYLWYLENGMISHAERRNSVIGERP